MLRESGPAGIWTGDLSIASLMPYRSANTQHKDGKMCVMFIHVGVADQLQTNYASDLRHMLKSVFDSFTLDVAARLDAADDSLDTFRQRLPLTESSTSSHLSSRTVTAADRGPSNNHLSATSSVLGEQCC